MKIITVNCPESFIDAMEEFVGENNLYPSRSELVRVAVREFLINKINLVETIEFIDKEEKEEVIQNTVRIPIGKIKINGKIVDQFKCFTIIKKLDTRENEIKKSLMKYDKPKIKKESINNNIFWEEQTGIFRISKENPKLAYIKGFGLVKRIES